MSHRFDAMRDLFRSGWTLQRIADAFDLSRERVRQILASEGLTKQDGGQMVLTIERKRRLLRDMGNKRELRTRKTYGCSHARAVELNGGRNLSDSNGRAHTYLHQRQNAIGHRNIVWAITFPEWCQVWDESGKWDQRGRGKHKYCMSRVADIGCYSIGNVEIITNSQNAKDSYLVYTAAERTIKRGQGIRDELGFTPGQRRVYDLLVAGMNNRAIAAQLNMNPSTVACYKSQVLRMQPLAA